MIIISTNGTLVVPAVVKMMTNGCENSKEKTSDENIDLSSYRDDSNT